MLDIPGTCVAQDSTEAEIVKKQNEDYAKVNRFLCSSYDTHVYLTKPGFLAACRESSR